MSRGNYIEVEKINYMLDNDFLRSSSLKNSSVIFEGLGVQRELYCGGKNIILYIILYYYILDNDFLGFGCPDYAQMP